MSCRRQNPSEAESALSVFNAESGPITPKAAVTIKLPPHAPNMTICGPADFLVEIISPGDKSRDKVGFYAALRVRELLVIDRYSWSLELYRLGGNELVLAGRSTDQRSDVIASLILPVSFQLLPAQPRPEIRIARFALRLSAFFPIKQFAKPRHVFVTQAGQSLLQRQSSPAFPRYGSGESPA